MLTIEPNNRRAQDSLRQLDHMRSLDEKLELARGDLRRGDIYGADRQVKQILELDPKNEGALELQSNVRLVQSRNVIPYPQLRTRLDRPVTLEFRDANLKTIFEVLSQVAGLNFIFDKDLRPDMKATIFVRDVRIEDAVELLLQQNQLHQKVVNENTLLIYPDSPQKLKDYQELVMRTFYLTSIDANTALNMIKTMLKTRDVFVDERLNTLTMRDSEDAVRMAEKLLQSQDQSNPEVVLEVEVMEVATQRILDLGLQWPNTFGVVNSDGSAVTLLDQLKGINSSRITISPSPQAKINAQDNDINTLASPVIRVSNREQARIHIGQRVPIISATSVPSTQGPVITESVTYLDVGLKLEVQPTVHLNNEVAIKIALEVSNATPLEPTRQGTIPVQVDTRNAQTTLRLHDGETQILAGLMRNDHGATGNKIPGLGDIPGLGRLFGSNKDTRRQVGAGAVDHAADRAQPAVPEPVGHGVHHRYRNQHAHSGTGPPHGNADPERTHRSAGCFHFHHCCRQEALIMKASQRGFTLIEVVVTLALIGLLAGMAAPLTETVVRRGKEQELRTALYQIRDAIDAYKRAFDAGYIEKSLNSSGYPPNLQVLVEGVRDVRSAKGAKFYFLRRVPHDPLAPVKRDDEGGWGVRSYDSTAQNPRDGEDVFDVYSKARGKGLNGIAYREW